jgi:hypothetical protein
MSLCALTANILRIKGKVKLAYFGETEMECTFLSATNAIQEKARSCH